MRDNELTSLSRTIQADYLRIGRSKAFICSVSIRCNKLDE